MSKVDWAEAPKSAEFYAGGFYYKHNSGGSLLHMTKSGWVTSDFTLAGLKTFDNYEERPQESAKPAEPDKKTAAQYLSECIEVQKQRGEQYDSSGTGERSFDAAAKAYNALTGGNLKGSDVCLLLTCVKAVRQYSNPSRLHEDSLLDGVSYLSLWAEELNKELEG